ncbi:MAG: hypothetical protein HY862_20335 [Chloroflexi bacterium]|nr:hypothetical protein [Chloroflexota bacterium]
MLPNLPVINLMTPAIFQKLSTQQRRIGYTLIAVVLLSLYLYGAIAQSVKKNTSPRLIDQSSYLHYAEKLRESAFTNYRNGNQMPLYPLIQSLHYVPNSGDMEFFRRGRWLNIGLSVVVLAGVAWIFFRRFPPLLALNLLLMSMFTVFMFKAGYFQVEVLYYGLTFISFLLMLRMLIAPTTKLAIWTGVITGLAYLAKASVLPAVGLFVGWFVLKWMYGFWKNRADTSLAQLRNGLLVVVVFLMVIAPFLIYVRVQFGHWFYNVNTTFYIWYDSWDEVRYGTRKYHDVTQYPNMPADEIPSMGKYLREHTVADMVGRASSGLIKSYDRHTFCPCAYGYVKFLQLYSVFALWACVVFWHTHLKILLKRHFFLGLFCLSYFAAYTLSYAWYVPIAMGHRFMLAMFLPFIFTIGALLTYFHQQQPTIRAFGRQVAWLNLFNLVTFLILVVDIFDILTDRITRISGAG